MGWNLALLIDVKSFIQMIYTYYLDWVIYHGLDIYYLNWVR